MVGLRVYRGGMNRQRSTGSYGNRLGNGAWFTGTPVTKWLMLALVVVYIVDELLMGHGLKFSLMLHPSVVQEVWRVVMYPLVDMSLGAWLFSLFSLFIFGRMVERVLGSRRYGVFIAYCVLAGGLVYVLVGGAMERGVMPLSGAIGIGYGVMSLAAAYYPNMMVQLLIPPIPMKLKTLVMVVIGIAVVMMVSQRQDLAVSLAHLSGVAVAWMVMQKPQILRVGESVSGARAVSRGRTAHSKRRPETKSSQGMKPRTKLNMRRNKHEAEVDAILEKVSAEGIGSLTEHEREILKFASKKNND